MIIGGSYIPDSPPATCPHCHQSEDIIEVCNHCGYKYPETASSRIGGIIFFAIIAIIIGGGLFWLFYTPSYPKLCNYKVPNDYELRKSKSSGKFIVFKKGDGCLYYDKISFDIEYILNKPPLEFTDSCEAKGFMEAYIEQEHPEINYTK